MSMEAYIFCSDPIGSMEDWQSAIDASGFNLRLQSSGNVVDHRGHLPALWRGREAGFEISPCDFAEVVRVYDDVDLGGPWPFAYEFRFGTLTGCVGTWLALAACMRITGGLAFDPQEGNVLTAEEATRYALETETGIDRAEAYLRGGTRNSSS